MSAVATAYITQVQLMYCVFILHSQGEAFQYLQGGNPAPIAPFWYACKLLSQIARKSEKWPKWHHAAPDRQLWQSSAKDCRRGAGCCAAGLGAHIKVTFVFLPPVAQLSHLNKTKGSNIIVTCRPSRERGQGRTSGAYPCLPVCGAKSHGCACTTFVETHAAGSTLWFL